jgi:hypothetical protein
VRFALSPNDPRIAVLVGALDREGAPAAQTWREVGAAAERLGLARPSYAHVRRLVRVERLRRAVREDYRDELRQVFSANAAGRVPSAVLTLERLRELKRKEELVLQQHKAFGRRAPP